ncbi:MAG: malonyl CoA-acyl carrier protein transacylase [Phenylobacterium sp.]|jgi:malonyl CoA-acyl carrier protein transacylase
MKTYMFPGQGSQKIGMGGDLFDEFKDLTKQADSILGYSIKELCLEDPRKELGQTQFTQPALYVVNALSYYKKIQETGEKPDFVAGHSLGEFNALLAAECFDFASGLKLVKKRGELMSKVSGGGMAAVVNASKEEIEEILKTNNLDGIDLANFNTGSQIVISGSKDDINSAQAFFQEGMMQYHLLKTSGAFHSRYMEPSKKKFATYLKKFGLGELQIPVISNVTALPYQNDQVMLNLSSQIASSVKWSDSVHYLLAQGSEAEPMEFVEIGHGNVLTGLIRKITREVTKAAKAKAKEAAAAPAPVPAQTDKPKSFIDAEQQVKDWNSKHPIGTKVTSTSADYDQLETRTEAVVLFGHRAAVYMKSYNGYFDLNELAAG